MHNLVLALALSAPRRRVIALASRAGCRENLDINSKRPNVLYGYEHDEAAIVGLLAVNLK